MASERAADPAAHLAEIGTRFRSADKHESRHKTESIYRRYSIVDQAMLEAGAEKLEALQEMQRFTRPKVMSMKSGKSR